MKSKQVLRFGNDIIKENENYKYLGIINNKYLSKKVNIKDVTDKLKGTYFVLLIVGYSTRNVAPSYMYYDLQARCITKGFIWL